MTLEEKSKIYQLKKEGYGYKKIASELGISAVSYTHLDVYKRQEYQYYGIGQYKLIVERIKESEMCIRDRS